MNIEPYLIKHTEKLTNELAELMDQEFPEDVRCIQVMIFREVMPGIPFQIHFLNRFKSSARGIQLLKPLAELEVLVDSDEYLAREEAICECLDLDDENDQEACMDDVFQKYNSENLKIAKWFANCWLKSGGANFGIPAFIVEEDFQFNPINLKTGQQIKHQKEYDCIFDG